MLSELVKGALTGYNYGSSGEPWRFLAAKLTDGVCSVTMIDARL